MTIQDLKRRKAYIVAKITNIAGEENVKSYMELMLHTVEFGFVGTVYDLVMSVDFQLRKRSTKRSDFLANSMSKGREFEEAKGNVWNPITSSWEKSK